MAMARRMQSRLSTYIQTTLINRGCDWDTQSVLDALDIQLYACGLDFTAAEQKLATGTFSGSAEYKTSLAILSSLLPPEFRKYRSHPRERTRSEFQGIEPTVADDQLHNVYVGELATDLRKILKGMCREDQKIVVMIMDDIPLPVIARTLKVSETTAWRRCKAVKIRLARRLDKFRSEIG